MNDIPRCLYFLPIGDGEIHLDCIDGIWTAKAIGRDGRLLGEGHPDSSKDAAARSLARAIRQRLHEPRFPIHQ